MRRGMRKNWLMVPGDEVGGREVGAGAAAAAADSRVEANLKIGRMSE